MTRKQIEHFEIGPELDLLDAWHTVAEWEASGDFTFIQFMRRVNEPPSWSIQLYSDAVPDPDVRLIRSSFVEAVKAADRQVKALRKKRAKLTPWSEIKAKKLGKKEKP